MRNLFVGCLTVLLLAGCGPSRPITGTVSVEPSARQQLFTEEKGSRKGFENACAVDTTGLFQTVPGLADDSLQVGYTSTDLPKDARRRCRRDTNREQHAWLAFDLSEVQPPLGRLSHATLSGRAVPDPDNAHCPPRDGHPFGGFLAAINVAPQLRVTPNDDDTAQQVGPIDVDGESVSFRERELFLAEGDTSGRLGGAPLFVFNIQPSQFDYLASRLRTRINSDKPAKFIFLGADNTDITIDRVCLEQLQDIRLNLIFSAS